MNSLQKIEFNRGWKFRKNDGEMWQDIILPHSWNEEDMAPGIANPYIGGVWYRKEFVIEDLKPGQRVFLEFEAVALSSKVWVNGFYVGGREGGFLGFRLDITDAILMRGNEGEEDEQDGAVANNAGKPANQAATDVYAAANAADNTTVHTIEVFADNSFNPAFPPPLNIDWERYGGIYRPVWLVIKNHAFFSYKGIMIRTPHVSRDFAEVEIEAVIENTSVCGAEDKPFEIKHVIKDGAGRIVAECRNEARVGFFGKKGVKTGILKVENPHLWSVDDPYLYEVTSTLYAGGVDKCVEIDSCRNRIGFRYFSFDRDRGFSLNGVPLKLKGCNDHQEFPGMGHACPERYFIKTARQMKDMGLNYVRGSHYPRNDRFLDACDEMGIMVVEEQPFWHGSMRAAHGERFAEKAVAMTRELVEHHGNHPCIILWNTANEIMLAPIFDHLTGHAEPGDPRRAKWGVKKEEVPYIKRTLSSMYNTFRETDPTRPVMYVVGGSWKWNDEYQFTEIPDIVGYNGGVMNRMNFPDPETGKKYPLLADYLHVKYPNRIAIMSEGIINSPLCMHRRGDWEKEMNAWKTHAAYWNLIYERDWFAGGSMWNFTDYYAFGQLRVMGAMDVYRQPLEIYHFYSSIWADRPVLHILCHWDWVHTEHRPQSITVFTNCSDVELKLNGKSLGSGRRMNAEWPNIPNPPIVWEGVEFVPGKLEATGIYNGEKIYDSRITSESPCAVALYAEDFMGGANRGANWGANCEDNWGANCGDDSSLHMQADGMDICFVTAVIVDRNGNRCYTENRRIKVKVEGSAVLKGEDELPAIGGTVRFAVRSDGTKGKCIVRASGDGLQESALIIHAE